MGTPAFRFPNQPGSALLVPQSDGSWSESVLYSFHLGTENDGGVPVGRLVIDASGNLYGATDNGGTYYGGTVFEITR